MSRLPFLLPMCAILVGCPSSKQHPEAGLPEPGAVSPGDAGAAPMVDQDGAKVLGRKALERRAQRASALLTTGKKADAREALKILQEISSSTTVTGEMLYNEGYAHETLGNTGQAREAYRKVTELDPGLGAAWLRLGLLYEADGNLDSALATFRQGSASAPEDMDLKVAEMAILIQSGRHEQAITAAKQALKVNANSVPVYVNLGMAYIEQGKLDMAIFIFQGALQSVEGARSNPYIHAYLGRAYYLKGYNRQARDELEAALKLDQELLPPMVYLADLHLDNRAWSDLIAVLERARTLSPEEPVVRLGLGIGYRGLERFDDAQKEYEAVIRMKPAGTEAYLNLAILFGDYMKEFDEAIRVLGEYKQVAGNATGDADAWIQEFTQEKERAARLADRKRKADEARKKREEEQRFLEEFEKRKQQEQLEQQKQQQPEAPAQAPAQETESPAQETESPAEQPDESDDQEPAPSIWGSAAGGTGG